MVSMIILLIKLSLHKKWSFPWRIKTKDTKTKSKMENFAAILTAES